MYFTSGSDRAFEQLMQGKPGFDHYDSGEAVTPEDCGTCRFYRPHWKYQFCVYAECPYQPGKLTAYDAVTFRVKGVVENMKQGALIFDERSDRYDIRFDLSDYYGGLHCGDCLEVFVRGKWKPTRMEYGQNWYLVGIRAEDLNGLRVRI